MARRFDGVDDRILCTDNTGINGSVVVASCWVRVPSGASNSGFDHILDCDAYDGDGSSGTPYCGWSLKFASGTQFMANIWHNDHGTNDDYHKVGNDFTFTNDVWHHLLLRSVVSGPLNQFWVDGSKVGSDETTNARDTSTGRPFCIGARAGAPTQQPGQFDIYDLAVYSANISDASIARLAAGHCPMFVEPASLALYLPLWGRQSSEAVVVGGSPSYAVTGATYIDHPAVRQPTGALYGSTDYTAPSPATGSSLIAWF